MVEPREIVELGNLSKVLRQLVQLLVLLPVQMGLHEGADLVRTHMHKHTDTQTQHSYFCLTRWQQLREEERRMAMNLQSILWVHEEVPSNVIKHDCVLSVVEISILPPYHTEGLNLDVHVWTKINIWVNKGQRYHLECGIVFRFSSTHHLNCFKRPTHKSWEEIALPKIEKLLLLFIEEFIWATLQDCCKKILESLCNSRKKILFLPYLE